MKNKIYLILLKVKFENNTTFMLIRWPQGSYRISNNEVACVETFWQQADLFFFSFLI